MLPNSGCKKLRKFFAGKSLKDMSDSELIKEFKLYQQTRLTSGPYFTQRYEVMNEDLLKQFIKTKSEASPTLIDFFRTFGRFDAGEHTNIHVDCYPRVSGSIFSGTGGFLFAI